VAENKGVGVMSGEKTSEELLPCPFCVGRSLVYEHWNEAGHQTFHVKCLHCGATTDYWGSREEVVNIWNTRHVVCKTTKEEIEEAKAWRKENGNSWGRVITEPLDFDGFSDYGSATERELELRAKVRDIGMLAVKQQERREFVKQASIAIAASGSDHVGCLEANYIINTAFDLWSELDKQLTELEKKESNEQG
jgi:hypothetical protein